MEKNGYLVSRRYDPLQFLLRTCPTRASLRLTFLLITLIFASTTGAVFAATSSDSATENSDAPAKPAVSVQLITLQKQLDKLKQNVSVSTSDNELNALKETSLALVRDADILLEDLKPKREQLQTQLDVLGPPPAAGSLAETPVVHNSVEY